MEAIMMVICIIGSFIIAIHTSKIIYEDEIYGLLSLAFLFFGLAGIVGLIVKTFHIWGNGWN